MNNCQNELGLPPASVFYFNGLTSMDLVNEIKRELFFATFFVDVNSKDRPMFTHGSASESSTECVSEK
jgi:hypothetical protein